MTKNIEVEFQAFEEFMINILSDGGLVKHYLKEKVVLYAILSPPIIYQQLKPIINNYSVFLCENYII